MRVELYSRERTKVGFTLLELVVSLTIVSLLVSLVLCAVVAVREQSRAVQCKNHLRQWSIGVVECAARRTKLPSFEERLPADPGYPLGAWLSIQREIEGSLERYRKHAPNMIMKELPIHPAYSYCPSESAPGIINYRFNTGSGGHRGLTHKPIEQANGPFVTNGFDVPLSRITDGLSNVAGVSERFSAQSGSSDSLLRFAPMSPSQLGTLVPDDYGPLCNQPNLSSVELEYVSLPHGYRIELIYYSHVFTPNSKVLDCVTSNVDWSISARGHHAGRVHVGFLDGHVSAISDAIELDVWRCLGGIDDGAVAPSVDN